MTLEFNPFNIYSISQYNQYKDCPFLESHSAKLIKNAILGQIRDNYANPERLILLGERGLGKTTTLFFIKDLLEHAGYKNVFFLSKFILDNECLQILTGKSLKDFINEKAFFLVDFQDTINLPNLKKFLEFVWDMMNSPYYKNLNFIFSMNISHYNYTLSISELLGKFDRIRMERMTLEETKELISSRLLKAGNENFFREEVFDCIYDYSQGIPRNVICASRSLVDNFFDKDDVDLNNAQRILREVYTDKIINDRVEDPSLRSIFKGIIEIISTQFGGVVESQELLSKKIKEDMNIGRNRSFQLISELDKFGIIIITKGGENNNKKVIRLI
jgi:hypothetical protein